VLDDGAVAKAWVYIASVQILGHKIWLDQYIILYLYYNHSD
jgi:hypothetical protein